MKKKKQSQYIDYTEKEVVVMENNYFVLQLGGDFVIHDDCYLFTKNETHKLYNSILKDLVGIVKDGSNKDKKYALDLIAGFIVLPMRLH